MIETLAFLTNTPIKILLKRRNEIVSSVSDNIYFNFKYESAFTFNLFTVLYPKFLI